MIPISACDKCPPERIFPNKQRGDYTKRLERAFDEDKAFLRFTDWKASTRTPRSLRRCGLAEGLNGLLFTVIDLENSEQLGDL